MDANTHIFFCGMFVKLLLRLTFFTHANACYHHFLFWFDGIHLVTHSLTHPFVAF